jgi:hypothetical protein
MSVCGSADQAPQLSRVMREKLGRSQAILAAVIKSDWAALDREGRALALATKDPSWAVLTSPEYLRQTDAYIKALQALAQASERRDLEAAANAHVALTLSCVQCHLHMTRQRMAAAGAMGPTVR